MDRFENVPDGWTRIAKCGELPPGSCGEFVLDGRIIALFHVDGVYHALDGVCPHQGGPLGRGSLQEGIVTCPWHGWQFDVASGKCLLSPAIEQPTIATKVTGDDIFVQLPPS